MKGIERVFVLPVVFLSILFFINTLLAGQDSAGKPSLVPACLKQGKEEAMQKTRKLRIPFITNEGQMDERVASYAHTFGRTMLVTKDREIVYIASRRGERQEKRVGDQGSGVRKPGYGPQVIGHPTQGKSNTTKIALKEEVAGGKINGIQDMDKAATKVNYFKGNDASKWKHRRSAYDVVTLGEVYTGIDVQLKTYGNKVEKLFRVRPEASPDQIKIRLSGARALMANKDGQLETKQETGKLTKPMAYQEIDGKRIEVECGYVILDCGIQETGGGRQGTRVGSEKQRLSNPKSEIRNPKSEYIYGFKVAAYDKTKDLIIGPMPASTCLSGSDGNWGYSLALDTNENVYVAGSTGSIDLPTTSGVYDTSSNGWADTFVSKLEDNLSSSGSSKGYSISGTIYQSDGVTPITDADIWTEVYQGDPCGDYTYVASSYTNNGIYKIYGLPPGTYYVRTEMDNQSNYLDEWWAGAGSVLLTDCSAAESITIGNASVSGKDFQLDTGYSISGTIYQSDGVTPITDADIGIRVYQDDPCDDYTHVASSYTSKGVYTVYGLTPGTYYVRTENYHSSNYPNEWWAGSGSVPLQDCSAAGPITISDASVSGKDFQLDTAYSISGRLYQSDGVTPITDADIEIYVYQGDPCGSYTEVAGGYTSKGVYTVYGLTPGTYYVCTSVWNQSSNYLDEWWAGNGSVLLTDCRAAESITISNASVSGKDFQLDTAYSISGRLYQSDGVTPITDADIGIRVYQGDPCGDYTYVAWGGYTSNGVYTVYGLTPGTYYVRTENYNHQSNYLDEWWAGTGSVLLTDCSAAGPVTISNASASGKDFQLDAGYSISGTIYQSDGVTPITDADIGIRVYQGDPCGDYTYVAWGGYTSNGVYTVYGLTPGTYYVCTSVWNQSSNYLDEWWAGNGSVLLTDCSAAESITISNASVSGKDFQLDTTYSISGRLYKSDGVTPITNADIGIYVYQDDPCGDYTYVASSYTSKGVYTVYGLTPGTYYVRTENYQSSNYLNEWWAGDGSVPLSDCGAAGPITISNASVSGKHFQLDTAYSISGRLYQSDGVTPITDAGIYIEVYQDDPCGDYTYVASSYTNNGIYKIYGLTPGTYYVRTYSYQSSNYLDEWWAGAGSVPLSDCSAAGSITISNASVSGKHFQLDTGYSISGTIYQSDGVTPITDAYIGIRVYQDDPCGDYTYVASSSTSKGVYTVYGLTPGTYYVRTENYNQSNYLDEWWAGAGSVLLTDCSAAESITISNASVSGKDFQLDTAYSISGTIYQSDGITPITDADIGIYVFQGDPCSDYTYVAWGYVSKGVYTVYGLTPGTYYLRTENYNHQSNYLDEWWAGAGSVLLTDCSAAESITISNASVSGKDFQLDTGYSISGTIYQADGVTPITDADIGIYVFQGDPCGNYTYVAYGHTSNGVYTVYGLPPGTYYVRTWIYNYQSNYLDEWWAGDGSVPLSNCSAAGSITIGNASVSGKDFQLDTGYSISGTIYQSDGITPITDADIGIYVFQGDPCSDYTYVAEGYVSKGNYTVYGLTSGTYYVFTSNSQSSNYLNEWWAGAGSVLLTDCSAAESITIGNASVSGKDFQLDTGYSISGTIYQADGVTPITDARIYIEVYQGDPCGSYTEVAGDYTSKGNYTVYGLPPGTYYVRTSVWNQSSNYLNEWWAGSGSVLLMDCSAAESITISNASVSGKDFQLDTGYSISGTIYQADGVTPITDARIYIEVYQGDPCGSYTEVAWGYTSNGIYTVYGLPPGTYHVRTSVWNQSSNYVNEWWSGAGSVLLTDCSAAGPITISDASVSGKDFQLDTGYSISGTIYQSDGVTSITDADISIEVCQGDPCGSYTEVAWGYTSNGIYTVYGLPPGTYYVRTSVWNHSTYANEWWALSGSVRNCHGAGFAEITDSSISGKNFQLDKYLGIAAHYALNEENGTVISDSSGNGNNGTISGATWTMGIRGSGLSFDGIDDYVDLGNPPGLQPEHVSLSVWFKTDTSGGKIIRKRWYGYCLEVLPSGQTAFWIYDATARKFIATSPNAYNDNTWHHAVGVYDGAEVKLSIDGALVATASAGAIHYEDGGIAIGRDGDHSGAYFNGIIDEIRVYGRALNDQEIQNLYNVGTVASTTKNTVTSLDSPDNSKETDDIGANARPAFNAKAGHDGTINRHWKTSAETGAAGFNRFRSRQKNGTHTKINNAPINARGNGPSGTRYNFEDEPRHSKSYYDKLEKKGSYGKSTMYGPTKVRKKSSGNE